MINWNGVIIKTWDQLQTITATMSDAEKQSLIDEFNGVIQSLQVKSQKEKDYDKYMKRASVKDNIIAEMASENMNRVRTGIWTTQQLITLTQDQQLKMVLDDITTLSYELAISKIQNINNPIVTNEIKTQWINKLKNNLYNG